METELSLLAEFYFEHQKQTSEATTLPQLTPYPFELLPSEVIKWVDSYPLNDVSKRTADELICAWPLTLTIAQGQAVLSEYVARYPRVRRQHTQMSSLRYLGDVINKVASVRDTETTIIPKTKVHSWRKDFR